MDGHKAKTKNATYQRVGHTTANKFGQSDSAQEKGTKSGSGSEQSYK